MDDKHKANPNGFTSVAHAGQAHRGPAAASTGLAVFLLLVTLGAPFVVGQVGSDCSPPPNGTWTITGKTVVCTGELQFRNLVVNGFGSLTLRDCHVLVDSIEAWNPDGSDHSVLRAGATTPGTLRIEDDCVVDLMDPETDYQIVQGVTGSVLNISRAVIRNVLSIQMFDENAVVEHSVLEETRFGFSVFDGAPRITNNYLRCKLGWQGSAVSPETTPLIENNVFVGCGTGLRIWNGAAPIIRHNSFTGNQVGIGPGPFGMDPLEAHDNDIFNNFLQVYRGTPCPNCPTIDAIFEGNLENNWWGRPVPDAARIFPDDEGSEQPDYSPWRAQPVHPERYPTPLIGPLPSQAERGQVLSFDATASRASTHFSFPLERYVWDFGDGARMEGARIQRAYTSSGTFTVNLQVIDEGLLSRNATWTITVPNQAPVITGVAVDPAPPQPNQAFTVTPSASDGDGDALTFTYRWKHNGAVREDLNQLNTPTVPGSIVRSGDVWETTVTAYDPYGGQGQLVRSIQVNVNQAPIASVDIDPGQPVAGMTLTASGAASDPEGQPVEVSYRWIHNGIADDSLEGPTVPGDRVKVRDTWTVQFIARDSGGAQTIASDFVSVPDAPPVIRNLAITPVSPSPGQALTATYAVSDPDGDEVLHHCTWRRDGVPQDVQGCQVPAGRTRAAEPWEVTVSASSHSQVVESKRSVTIGNQAPIITSLQLTPESPRRGDALTATVVGADADNHPVIIRYEWKRDGAVQGDLTGPTVPSTRIFKGTTWTVTATPNDGHSDGPSRTASVTIQNTAPTQVRATASPVAATVGQAIQLTLTASDLDGDPLEGEWTLPSGQVLTGLAQSVAFDAAGTKAIGYELADGQAPPITGTVTVEVSAPPSGGSGGSGGGPGGSSGGTGGGSSGGSGTGSGGGGGGSGTGSSGNTGGGTGGSSGGGASNPRVSSGTAGNSAGGAAASENTASAEAGAENDGGQDSESTDMPSEGSEDDGTNVGAAGTEGGEEQERSARNRRSLGSLHAGAQQAGPELLRSPVAWGAFGALGILVGVAAFALASRHYQGRPAPRRRN